MTHLTPTELARELGITRRQVIMDCMKLGVPIRQGRIDPVFGVRPGHGKEEP